MSYEFYAFISYKRGDADEKWARRLQAELERYRIPVADLRLRARPDQGDQILLPKRLKVFRDKSDLGSHFSVTDGLFENLDVSRFLIVICSRRGAQSPYVDAEARRFMETGQKANIIPFVIDDSGADPVASVPPSLPADVEALVASGDHEETFIHLLARLLRVDRDKLRQAHLRASRRRAFFALATVAPVLFLTAGLALWAVSAEKRATERRIESEGLVDFLTFDLIWEAKAWLPAKKTAAVTVRVREYYERWEARSRRAIIAQAANLRYQGEDALLIDGRTSEALALASRALQLLERLYQDQPDDETIMVEYSHTLLFMGYLATMAGDREKGQSHYRQSLEGLRAFAESQPDSLWIKGRMAQGLVSLARDLTGSPKPLQNEQNAEEAEALFQEAEELWQEMLSRWPRETHRWTWRMDYGNFWSFRARSAMMRGDFKAALDYFYESYVIFEDLYLEHPQNRRLRFSYAFELALIMYVMTKSNLLDLADESFLLSYELWPELLRDDPHGRHTLGWIYLLSNGGFLRIEQGRLDEADELLNRAEKIVSPLILEFPELPAFPASREQIEGYRELARQKSAGGAK